MKKLISIEDLKYGMFLEADVVDGVVDGETVSFLGARDAVSKGAKGRRAKLTGRMNTRVQRDGVCADCLRRTGREPEIDGPVNGHQSTLRKATTFRTTQSR